MPLNRGLNRFGGPTLPGGMPLRERIHASGLAAARPPACPANAGMLYLATDTSGGTLYRSTGTAWVACAPGVTGGSGTVTSVGLSLPSEISVTGSPVTSSGTLTGSWAIQLANVVFAAPSGSGGTPSFRALTATDLPALNGFTDADWALDDRLPFYDTSALANRDGQTSYLLGLLRVAPGGRLTLTSGTPVTTSDVTAAGTLYYTPYYSDVCVLWDGTRWVPVQFSETSLALSGLTSGKPYDVFAYLSAGVLTLELLVWTNDSTRATAVTIQDGRYCKSGDKTRLLLGTIYTTGTTSTEDSVTKRYVSNVYNREPRTVFSCPGYSNDNATTSYTTTSTSFTTVNSGTGAAVYAVFTLPGVFSALSKWDFTTAVANAGRVGVGLDTTTQPVTTGAFAGGSVNYTASFPYIAAVAAGMHYMSMMYQTGGGTLTVNADLGRPGGLSTDAYATFINGTVMG